MRGAGSNDLRLAEFVVSFQREQAVVMTGDIQSVTLCLMMRWRKLTSVTLR